MNDGWNDVREAADGFLGSVLSGLGQGAGKVVSEVLPVWAQQQMGVQTTDQLRNDTFNPINGQQRLPVYDTGQGLPPMQTPPTQPAGFIDMHGTGAVGMVIAIGLALAAGVAIAKIL